jgi:uncharacterized protein YceK
MRKFIAIFVLLALVLISGCVSVEWGNVHENQYEGGYDGKMTE